MADPVTLLGNLSANERRAWQRVQAEQQAGACAERLTDLRRDAQDVTDRRADTWRQTYEEGRSLERRR